MLDTTSQTFEVVASHTEKGGFTIVVPDEDAHRFAYRYAAVSLVDGNVLVEPITEKGSGRIGVRPGAKTTRKGQEIRYMQFLGVEGLSFFSATPGTMRQSDNGRSFHLELPPEDKRKPAREINGSKHAKQHAPMPNPDPIPEQQLELPSDQPVPMPAPISEPLGVRQRVSIRDAVARVNAFLRDTEGAEVEIFVDEPNQAQSIRVTVVETYE